MKNYIRILFLVVMAFVNTVSNAQTNIEVRTIKDGTDLLVKWAPTSYKLWKDGIDHGYRITRYTLTSDSTSQSGTSVENVLILEDSLKIDTIALRASNTQASKFVMSALFDSIPSSISFENAKLADAIQQKRGKENTYFFYTILADQSFENALELGLAYRDQNFDPLKSYMYQIDIVIDTLVIKGSTSFYEADSNPTSLKSIDNLTGYSHDKKIVLQWTSQEESYSFYNIERSENGVNFAQVNSDPYLFLQENHADEGNITFEDSVPTNNTDYYYRVYGLSYFGIDGPFSDTIMVQAKPDKYLINISIDTIVLDNANTQVSLRWKLESDSITKVIIDNNEVVDYFNIIYQSGVYDSMTIVNSSPIPYNLREFEVVAPAPTGYFSIHMVDKNGLDYLSIQHLVQFPDTIPPSIPTGLNGVLDQNGNLDLTWDDNTEEDLDGYLVYMSTDFGASYQVMQSEPITTNRFSYLKDPELHIDSLTFSVTAIDTRFNESDYSDPLTLAKPDNQGPSKPLITYGMGVEGGIRLGWIASTDEDVDYHVLQKKKHNSKIWTPIVRFFNGQTFSILENIEGEVHPCLHIDSINIGIGLYDYRLEAYDRSGNASFSDIKTVAAYDNGIRGQIDEGYAIGSACQIIDLQSGAGSGSTSGGNNSGGGFGSGAGGGGSNPKPIAYDCTLVTWEYISKYKHSLLYFKVYRVNMSDPNAIGPLDVNGQPQTNYRLIKTIRIPEAQETAATFPTTATYAFIDENGTKPGKDIRYKIIAEHSDGGSSEWSVEILVP